MNRGVCIFCLRDESRGLPCTYGLPHEYPVAAKKQEPKKDKGLCERCGLHKLNPAASSGTCIHVYPV